MEKNCDQLNYELKQCSERCTDLEDRLVRERKLRKRIEKDSDELRDMYESRMDHSEDSGTCSSSDESHYGRQQKGQEKCKKIPNRSLQKNLQTSRTLAWRKVWLSTKSNPWQSRPRVGLKVRKIQKPLLVLAVVKRWIGMPKLMQGRKAEVMRTTKNVMYYPLTAQTVKKWMRRWTQISQKHWLIWQSTQMKQKTFRVKVAKKRYSIQEKTVREWYLLWIWKKRGMFEKGV